MESLSVLKIGGPSIAGCDRVRQVAGIVLKKKSAGRRIIVVVSAGARQTDRAPILVF